MSLAGAAVGATRALAPGGLHRLEREILERLRSTSLRLNRYGYDPYGFSPNIRKARVAILNAYLLPGGEESLYPSISPVNSFRVILNEYFGHGLPLLPDKSYRTNSGRPNAIVPIVGDVTPENSREKSTGAT